MQLALIPGHRPGSPGVESNGVAEFTPALILCHMIHDREPKRTTIHRRPDTADGLSSLIHGVNRSDADALLSIHFNAAEGESPPVGYSCVYPGAEEANTFADCIRHKLERWGPRRVSARSRPQLLILSETDVPAVLDEPAYLDRDDHRRSILGRLDELAHYYTEAIRAFDYERTL
jgi:hypothetical protein